jgi:hypothetical protein
MSQGGNEQHGMEMRRTIGVFCLAIITLILVSCGPEGGLPPEDSPIMEYPQIDPLFREYYDQIGGADALGPAISAKFEYDGLECQFTTNALMVHDPQSPERQGFYLASIGMHMNLIEPPVPNPGNQNIKYVDGHVIHEEFVPIYEQMGGGLVVGKPLTELHYNPIKKRYEQYFENVGFYRMEGDSTGSVGLLAYGSWFCPDDCQNPPPGGKGEVLLSHHTSPEFIEAIGRLGPTFTGFAISEDYHTPDGYTEQVFENVVMISDSEQPGGVLLRPVPEHLGYLPETPVTPSNLQGMVFYPTKADGRGFHVPEIFMDYIAQHGGQEIIGQPIDQYRLIRDNVYRQCFQNVCLEEHLDVFDYLRVRPSPLGYVYREMPVSPVYSANIGQNSGAEQTVVLPTAAAQESITSFMPASQSSEDLNQPGSSPQVSIQVWESFPMIAPDGYQEVGVSVYENDVPFGGIEPDLYVTLPDGTKRTYYMYPTGEDGQSRLVLEPINAPHGTLIPYEVCVFLIGGQKLCVKESYLIWQNQ